MNCPKCKNTSLKQGELKSKNLQLDQCLKCKGLWFDDTELPILLAKKSVTDFCIPKFAFQNPDMQCPKCKQGLYEFCYPGTLVLIDSCKSCHGIWLDDNEWKSISEARDESTKITCPKCNTRQKPIESCKNCGVIMNKYNSGQDELSEVKKPYNISHETENSHAKGSYADNIPGIKGLLLRNIESAISSLSSKIGF